MTLMIRSPPDASSLGRYHLAGRSLPEIADASCSACVPWLVCFGTRSSPEMIQENEKIKNGYIHAICSVQLKDNFYKFYVIFCPLLYRPITM